MYLIRSKVALLANISALYLKPSITRRSALYGQFLKSVYFFIEDRVFTQGKSGVTAIAIRNRDFTNLIYPADFFHEIGKCVNTAFPGYPPF